MPKTLKEARAVKADPGGYVMILRSVGNPDFGQYAPVSEPKAVKGPTLASMIQAAEDYIEFWDIGGGNWVEPEIRDASGKPVAVMSYNRRLWDGDVEVKL